MTCKECKELYVIYPPQPFYPFWCKFFKYYLLPDKDGNPIQSKECKELNE